jgi:hypothetical protein
MPIEFAAVAYRSGHSLIRPFNVLNDTGAVKQPEEWLNSNP